VQFAGFSLVFLIHPPLMSFPSGGTFSPPVGQTGRKGMVDVGEPLNGVTAGELAAHAQVGRRKGLQWFLKDKVEGQRGEPGGLERELTGKAKRSTHVGKCAAAPKDRSSCHT